MDCRILDRMKVTALIPNEIIEEVKQRSKGKNITDALVIALSDWLATKRLQEINLKLAQDPLEFRSGFSASKARALSRRGRR
jgi:predicted DNA-binding ribbon-helix-helix protein